jgi:hypothetical protein
MEELPKEHRIADDENTENVRIVVDDDGGWEPAYDHEAAAERALRVLKQVVDKEKAKRQ